jgi:UDP-2,3-diacylglucosamine pyrophosphatase LpxH
LVSRKKAKEDGQDCKGIVLGHLHLPLIQEAPELPYLLNDGDMRHSATFVLQDDDGFHLIRWDYSYNQWLVISSLQP